jgi:phosphatidate cytidylyltransferase
MKQRAITAVFFVIAMLGGVFGGYYTFLILFGFITAGAGWELLSLTSGEESDHLLVRKVTGAVLALLPFAVNGWMYLQGSSVGPAAMTETAWAIVALPVFVLLLVELALAASKPFTHMGHYTLAVVYVGIPMALLISIAFSDGQYMPMRVMGLLFLNWMNDTFAYLTGSMIGKTPFFSRISPKKTWEGTLGGIVCTILIAWGLSHFLTEYSPSEWLVIAFCVSVFGTVGDLIESMLKRSVGVKDSGTIMPGHGGFLDRFDSFIFLLPFVWLALRFC